MAFKQWATGNGQFAKKTLAVALKLLHITENRSVIVISFIGYYIMQIANWKSGAPRIIGNLL
jgi:hypothetical protein